MCISMALLSIVPKIFPAKGYRAKTKRKASWKFMKHLFYKNIIMEVWLWKGTAFLGCRVRMSKLWKKKRLVTQPAIGDRFKWMKMKWEFSFLFFFFQVWIYKGASHLLLLLKCSLLLIDSFLQAIWHSNESCLISKLSYMYF